MQATQAPGQQHTGRFTVLDDLERYGSTQAIEALRREGAVGLFAHTRPAVDAFSAALQRAGLDATAHVWDLYHAPLQVALAAVAEVTRAHEHSDTVVEVREDWGADLTQRCQSLMQTCGVMPATQATLRGQVLPSHLAIATQASGHLVGVGSLLWGHCPLGPWHHYAHLGMGSVDPSARMQSLGKRLAASLIQSAAIREMTAGITAACAGDNLASAHLLRDCGLQRDAQRVCVMFTLDGARKTR